MRGFGKKDLVGDPLEFMPELHGFRCGYQEGVEVNPRPCVVTYPPGAAVMLQDNAGW